jgi:hypothetical protein
MKPEDRIMFMKKTENLEAGGKVSDGYVRKFSFVIEATEAGECLVESYIGVEFSIIYKVIIKM